MRFLDEEAANVKRTIERLYDEKDALRSQNQALQERAERAEALLVRWHEDREPCGAGSRLDGDTLEAVGHLLSPTQETDEPDCTRCGNERTVGGYGTDERFPCPVCRPTQETDPE
jgi:hypothetical protein